MMRRENEYIKVNSDLDDFQILYQPPHKSRLLHPQDRYVPSHNYDAFPRFYAVGADTPKRDEGMTSKALTNAQMWIGIGVSLLGVVIVATGASWAISNSINDKVNESRQELTTVINTSKSEVSARVDRLESKVDSGFASTTNGINDLKVILAGQKNAGNERPKD